VGHPDVLAKICLNTISVVLEEAGRGTLLLAGKCFASMKFATAISKSDAVAH
jgi:hypothetical protein